MSEHSTENRVPPPGELWQQIAVGYCEWENGEWPDDEDIRQAAPVAKHIASYVQRSLALTREEATCITRSIFRRCGYAIGEHGTRGRDLDLVAVPWTDRAGIPALVVEEVAEALEAENVSAPEEKPNGRLAWSIHPRRTARHDMWFMDLSVVVPEQYR